MSKFSLKFFEKFKKKEKLGKSLKAKVVTQKKANGIVSAIIFLVIVIVFSGTVRNFTAAGEVERLRAEVAILQQAQRNNVQQEGNIDLPLVWRYMDEFIPVFINVDFSSREMVENRFELLNEYFPFSYDHMNYAVGSQMSRFLQSSELLSVRSYQRYSLAQFRVTFLLTEKHLVVDESEDGGYLEEYHLNKNEQGNFDGDIPTGNLPEGETIPADPPTNPPATEEKPEAEDTRRVEAEYREEMAEHMEIPEIDSAEELVEDNPETDLLQQPLPEEALMEEVLLEEVLQYNPYPIEPEDFLIITREVTAVLNIPFIQQGNQITIISLPYFTGESPIQGDVEPLTRMEAGDSSQEMMVARQSIEQYLPIFFATYAESDGVALSLLMREVVLMGGNFVLEKVDLSQARYRFVGGNVLVQVEVIFRDRETRFTHREPFTLLLEEQANSWFVLEMHHLFID